MNISRHIFAESQRFELWCRLITDLTVFKTVLFTNLSSPPINLCGKWDSNSRYFWVEIRYHNQLGDYRILLGYTDSNCNHLSQNQEYCHYTISHFVGVIGFEPTCNHLLFLLLIRERRYTPIFCAPERIRTFMCISTVDPKSTGSNQFPHKGVFEGRMGVKPI